MHILVSHLVTLQHPRQSVFWLLPKCNAYAHGFVKELRQRKIWPTATQSMQYLHIQVELAAAVDDSVASDKHSGMTKAVSRHDGNTKFEAPILQKSRPRQSLNLQDHMMHALPIKVHCKH